MLRLNLLAVCFAGAAGKYYDPVTGTTYCGGATYNAPGAYMLRNVVNSLGGDLGEECEMLDYYDFEPSIDNTKTAWFQDRSVFGERNLARVQAWESANLVCEDLLVDSLNLPKKIGKLVWNHLGGSDGWNWGKCQEWDTDMTCRGGLDGCPDPSALDLSIYSGRETATCLQPQGLDCPFGAARNPACQTHLDKRYIQIDEVGDISGRPLSFRVTNLDWTDGPNPTSDGRIEQTIAGALQTQMQGAALQINLAPDSQAKFKYEFIFTDTEEQPIRTIWPICFTFYVRPALPDTISIPFLAIPPSPRLPANTATQRSNLAIALRRISTNGVRMVMAA